MSHWSPSLLFAWLQKDPTSYQLNHCACAESKFWRHSVSLWPLGEGPRNRGLKYASLHTSSSKRAMRSFCIRLSVSFSLSPKTLSIFALSSFNSNSLIFSSTASEILKTLRGWETTMWILLGKLLIEVSFKIIARFNQLIQRKYSVSRFNLFRPSNSQSFWDISFQFPRRGLLSWNFR